MSKGIILVGIFLREKITKYRRISSIGRAHDF